MVLSLGLWIHLCCGNISQLGLPGWLLQGSASVVGTLKLCSVLDKQKLANGSVEHREAVFTSSHLRPMVLVVISGC